MTHTATPTAALTALTAAIGTGLSIYQDPYSVYQDPASIYQDPASVYQDPASVYQNPYSDVYIPRNR